MVDDLRVVEQDLRVELAPDQLAEPSRAAFAGALRPRRARRVAHAQGAEAQVHRQVAGAAAPRKIARLRVRGDARHEGVEQRARAHAALPQRIGRQGLRREAQRLQRGQRRRRQPRQRAVQRRAVEGPQQLRVGLDVRHPGLAVRGIHRIGMPAAQGLRRHHDVVVDGVQRDAARGQRGVDCRVAAQRLRLVVSVGPHRVGAQPRGDLGHAVERPAVRDVQRAAERAQSRVELGQAGVDESHAAVGARAGVEQRLQDVGVEHEQQGHARAAAQGVMQRGAVVQAQVAAQPDQRESLRRIGIHRHHRWKSGR
ncbi:hypothetical protein GALL_405110 [mine drainage metagenome]|uniref:Uncharacterized protein n=1 Tax=mine drainage metagenome TaxID=410659 RepID=A0A1J5QPB1_9ZZZZ